MMRIDYEMLFLGQFSLSLSQTTSHRRQLCIAIATS
jgi:hypothetical protein